MKTVRPNSHRAYPRRGFALVITLVMVALLAIITIGVFTSVSLERVTAKSYNDRYQAELAAQNGLEAFKKTLASPPLGGSAPVTQSDTFLVVRVDGTQTNSSGTKDAYYYLAKPQGGTTNQIDYYPLFAGGAPATGLSIHLSPTPAPVVQTPVPPSAPFPSPAQDTTGNPYPKVYPFQQPAYTQWQELHDPNDSAIAAPYNLPYQRYTYWAEDLDGYLDASQVNDPNAISARVNGQSTWTDGAGTLHNIGTSPGEIAMFTIFAPTQQTISSASPTPVPVTNLVGSTETEAQNKRPLLFTVPTVQQLAATTPDVAGPNLAVRLGVDNNPGEQNLIPLGYGYGNERQAKTPINPVSQFRPNGNTIGPFANIVNTAMPNFANRQGTGGGQTRDYFNNLAANLFDYASPNDAPTEFMPPGNHDAPAAYRGLGAYPFVVSLYDLNNWVATVPINGGNGVEIETTTYVQLWNPHNFPPDGLAGALMVVYQNSDKIQVNGTTQTLSPPPDATIIFTDSPDPNNKNPVIVSPLFEAGNVNLAFNYQIRAAIGYQDPKGKIKPNEYRVVVLPGPTPACTPTGKNPYHYTASGLPPGLNVHGGGRFAGLISGTPTSDPPYTNGYRDYSVNISASSSCGTASAMLVIRIYQ